MSPSLPYTLTLPDGSPIDVAATDRLLGLADQFIENWEVDAAQDLGPGSDRELEERKAEWAAIRPLLADAPKLLSLCVDIARAGDVRQEHRRAVLFDAIAGAGAWGLLDPRQQDNGLEALASPSPIDPVLVAHVALGAMDTYRNWPNRATLRDVIDNHEGQVGFVDTIVRHAWRLDAVLLAALANKRETSCGIFAYDVAEPFGTAFAKAIFEATEAKPWDRLTGGARPVIDAVDPDAIAARLFVGTIEDYSEDQYPALLLQGARLLGRQAEVTAPVDVQAEHDRLNEAFPSEEADYDAGYRDATQSLLLALAQAGVPADTLHDAVTTALDAHANNAPEPAAGASGPRP